MLLFAEFHMLSKSCRLKGLRALSISISSKQRPLVNYQTCFGSAFAQSGKIAP